MSPEQIGIIGLVLFFILLFAKVHIAVAMGMSGLIGLLLIGGVRPAVGNVGISAFHTTLSYTLCLIPIFLVMGEFAYHSGLSGDAYTATQKLLGHLPGGLAIATIGGCAAFAAVCGSSTATASTMGTIALPEMRQRGYDPAMATGCVAAGGTLGILIPPSNAFVVYGIITEQPIGKLLIAGILPGLLLATLFIIVIFFIARRNPSKYPPVPKSNWRVRAVAVKNSWGIAMLFLMVIGSMYFGICTPTEAASLGAFLAFVIALVKRRLTLPVLTTSIMNALKTTGMIFFMMIGVTVFSVFVAISRLPWQLTELITTMNLSPTVFMIAIVLLFFVLGCIMEIWGAMLLVVPILVPSVQAMGFDLIWFGVVMVIMIEMGQITPPVGLNVYVIAGIARDVPIYTIFRGIWPFVGAMYLCLFILMTFPQIATWLPSTM